MGKQKRKRRVQGNGNQNVGRLGITRPEPAPPEPAPPAEPGYVPVPPEIWDTVGKIDYRLRDHPQPELPNLVLDNPS